MSQHMFLRKSQRNIPQPSISINQQLSEQYYSFLDSKSNKPSPPISDNHIKNIQSIDHHYQQLTKWIANINKKIQKVITFNQAEVLKAYKLNFAHIKIQLQKIKDQKDDQANNSSSYQERIQYLEKQLTIFRQESLKIFQNLMVKNKEIENIKIMLDQLMSQKKYNDQLIKTLLRKNKELQIKLHEKEDHQEDLKLQDNDNKNAIFITKKPQVEFLDNEIWNNRIFTSKDIRKRGRINSSNINIPKSNYQSISVQSQYKTIPLKDLPKKPIQLQQLTFFLKQKLKNLSKNELKDIIQMVELKWNKKSQKRSIKSQIGINNHPYHYKSHNKSVYNYNTRQQSIKYTQSNSYNSSINQKQNFQKYNEQLQNSKILRMAIQVVKKDITKRKDKKSSSLNFYKLGSSITLQQFKKIDYFRLMEIVFSSQNICQLLYKSLVTNY